jgi:uncharacterized membrane protein
MDLDVAAPPFHYNPSAWSQRIPIAILAAIGFVISMYLGLYQWRLIDSAWDPVFGGSTMKVLDSEESHSMWRMFGVPDATFGAIAYLGDAIFGLAGSTRRWQYRPWLVILFGIDVIPLGIVGAFLVFLQATTVGYWCFLCIVSAVISLILVYFACDEVWASLSYLWRVWKRTRSLSIVWQVTTGTPHPEAEAVALKRSKDVAARD